MFALIVLLVRAAAQTPAPPAACAGTCPDPATGYQLIDPFCLTRGDGFCTNGVCTTTSFACVSNADCTCGCVYAPDGGGGGAKRQVNMLVVGCHQNCSVHADCVDPQPQNMCLQRDCWDGVCMDVPAVLCPDSDTYDDPCTVGECSTVDGNATCSQTPIVGCCRQASDCPAAEPGTCQEARCVFANETAVSGECTFVNLTAPACCTQDAQCVDEQNLCLVSVCVNNSCSTPTPKDCSSLDTDNDRCTVAACNHTNGGACQLNTLDAATCPGACCFPANGTCADDDMMDKAWCLVDGGVFAGTNTTCNETRCTTDEPSPEPTPAPTFECATDDQCPTDPTIKCRMPTCVNNTCSFVDVECPPPGGDPCVVGTCQFDTGLCAYARNYSCCTNATVGYCPDPGGVCRYPLCLNNECVVARVADCRETDDECEVDANLCTRTHCNQATGQCGGPEVPRICPEIDGNDCTAPDCNATDGQCIEVPAAGHMKCPGACCLPGSSCTDVDYFTCAGLGGAWTDSDVRCADATNPCNLTDAPTPAPPTPAPPTPAPTFVPPRQCSGNDLCPKGPNDTEIAECNNGTFVRCLSGQCSRNSALGDAFLVPTVPCASAADCPCACAIVLSPSEVLEGRACVDPPPPTPPPTPAPTQCGVCPLSGGTECGTRLGECTGNGLECTIFSYGMGCAASICNLFPQGGGTCVCPCMCTNGAGQIANCSAPPTPAPPTPAPTSVPRGRCFLENCLGGPVCGAETTFLCADNQTELECNALETGVGCQSSTWTQGEACPTVPCCIGETCSDVSSYECECQSSGIGVISGAEGQLCVPNQCGQITCCSAAGLCSNSVEYTECINAGSNVSSDSQCFGDSCQGACCLSDGSCTLRNTQTSCTSIGGVWQGTLTECTVDSCPTPAPPPPCPASPADEESCYQSCIALPSSDGLGCRPASSQCDSVGFRNGQCGSDANCDCCCITVFPANQEPAPVPPSLTHYATLLCRVLHDCGDAGEALCAQSAADEAAVAECTELGCCRFDDVPDV